MALGDNQEIVTNLDLSWAVRKYGDGSWNAVISHAEQIAAEIFAEDEARPNEFKEGWVKWALKYFEDVRHMAHYGDCDIARSWMFAPWTCDACVYDEYMVKAFAKMKQDLGIVDDTGDIG